MGAKKHTAWIHAKVFAVLLTIASGPLVQMSTQWKEQMRKIALTLLTPWKSGFRMSRDLQTTHYEPLPKTEALWLLISFWNGDRSLSRKEWMHPKNWASFSTLAGLVQSILSSCIPCREPMFMGKSLQICCICFCFSAAIFLSSSSISFTKLIRNEQQRWAFGPLRIQTVTMHVHYLILCLQEVHKYSLSSQLYSLFNSKFGIQSNRRDTGRFSLASALSVAMVRSHLFQQDLQPPHPWPIGSLNTFYVSSS